jgi:transcriptional regulator NrdR family protein
VLRKAVDNEKITDEDIEIFIDDVEKYVFNKEDIVTSREIGLMILDWLKTRDALHILGLHQFTKDLRVLMR